MKLTLLKTAVPSVFPDSELHRKYLEKERQPLAPNALGPQKRKRERYMAFEKRNRKEVGNRKVVLDGRSTLLKFQSILLNLWLPK